MRKLFVISKAYPDENGDYKKSLIGILTELETAPNIPFSDETGKYQFEYKIGGKFHKKHLKVADLDDPNKIYVGDELKVFLEEYLPPFNCKPFFVRMLKAANMSEYDEWEWIKAFGQSVTRQSADLFETLPEGVLVYE